MSEPNYFAIIPAEVRYNKNLIPNAKLLYGEITALSSKEGTCWATNAYFAKLYKVSQKVVSTWISQLVEYGYLESELVYKTGTKQVEKRLLKITPYGRKKGEGMEEKRGTPPPEKVMENNTSNNNTSISCSSSTEETTPAFSQESWILTLSESPQPHIRLIAYYFGKYLDHNFPTKEVANDELKKNLVPSMFLIKNYEKKDITKALQFCQEKFSDVHWNLHTVKKQISYVTAKKG